MAHRSAATSSGAVIPGSCGASAPVTTPGNLSGRASRIAPAAHSASRREWSKQPNAPAVASASSASVGAPVRRVKSSSDVNGAGPLLVDAVEQRVNSPRMYRKPTRTACTDGSACQPDRGRPIGPAASVRASKVQSLRDAATQGLSTSTP